MKTEPLISVVIPTHSGAQVICRAVDSVLSQTYPNIEVVVVDDNGKGTEEQIATEKSMEKYTSDSRVKYLTHDVSLHGSAARNTGVKHSSGEFIALLDDDDYFLPNNLEDHYETQKCLDDSYGVTFCGMHIVRGKIEEDIIAKQEGDVLVDFLMGRMRVGSSLVMIRRSVYDEFNGFDESFKRHQDWEFLTRIFTKYKLASTHKIGIVKINLDRNSATNPQKFEYNRIYFLTKMKSIIDSLPANTARNIYDMHYTSIAKEYLRSRQFWGVIRWCMKTSRPLGCMFDILRSAFVYFSKMAKI